MANIKNDYEVLVDKCLLYAELERGEKVSEETVYAQLDKV